ncbi:hypothetical protein OIU84_029992 [Salix udensis]|uniref:Wall-associated receptor kinase-like 14 n=1 Tax=Salix udensis TaxID=889485 RepID=A0AAD6KAL6_9ROSI|nr:hypothetical protein OIU84_029992 [Salix udensis]
MLADCFSPQAGIEEGETRLSKVTKMSLQQESFVLFITIITVFITATSTTTRAQKFSSSNCKSSCGTGKHANVVPYPFGFSNGCPIILQCNQTVGDVKIGEFQVQNITPNGILINIPAECDRSIEKIRPLFGKNFSPSSNNSFLLQNCNSSYKSSSSCVISTSSLRRDLNLTNCGDKNHDLNCYSPVPGDSDTFDYQTVIVLTLCSNNATCTQVKLLGSECLGFRCHCTDGFAGDGFAAGNGCRRVSKCNVSKYMSGRCGGTTRVAVLVGGIIAGALLMACLALLWYYVRRKSTSLRNQSSAKRLLCEAAGNSSVPFFQYKEIEKATNGFSEKQSEVNLAALAVDRIGRGCVDEIIDSYLDPNRDAWTLTSIHSVAELAFRCLAFHRDMRPTMTEVAEELEQIMLSAWIPTMYMASPSTSSCSSEYGSQKSLSVSIGSLAGIAGGKLLPPQRTDSLTSLEETKDISLVSVQDTWLSEQSSPSKNSLLDNVVR